MASCLRGWSQEKKIPVTIMPFPAPEDFLFIRDGTKNFDILFVDIQMEHMNGLELVRRIRKTDREVALVSTAAIENYLEESMRKTIITGACQIIMADKSMLCLINDFTNDMI